jgi:anti-sigma factor RsiW
MNCTDFRRSVTAYADGEFAAVQDLEADRHLRTCPACAEHVADTTALKSALKHAYGGATAPPKLRDRILASLDGEVAATRVEEQAASSADGNGVLYRLVVPFGLAAAVFFAALAYWYWPSTGAHCVMDTKVAGRGPEAVRQQHRLCASHAADHHDPALTRDLVQIAQRLGDELSMAVIAPDLSSDGFALMGAEPATPAARTTTSISFQRTAPSRWWRGIKGSNRMRSARRQTEPNW